ncbi:hypothetical protein FA95DRAFT_1370638 [Auriscalpium vulgare]|uniref:Uncharacterized protein n=1 Tax=Auriscalpium vulgare TaxID=40419 RepID=A0ACB8RRF8_9AGAM|nr:hypothetical protein FA95DRAFT_1370638 [Auriscalpium vulgare]
MMQTFEASVSTLPPSRACIKRGEGLPHAHSACDASPSYQYSAIHGAGGSMRVSDSGRRRSYGRCCRRTIRVCGAFSSPLDLLSAATGMLCIRLTFFWVPQSSSAGRESFTLQSRSHLSHLSHRALPRYDSSSFACFVVQTVDGSHVSVMISQHVNSCTIVLSSTATIIITLLCILDLRLTTRLGLCQKTILECQPEADCLLRLP